MQKSKIIGLVLIFVISVLVLAERAFAQTYQVVNVMAAYDEELADTASWVYGYSPETFCKLIVDCVSDRFEGSFSIKFRIVHFVSWNSNNSNTEDIEELLSECINETGFYPGMTYNTTPIDILIAFSDQTIIKDGKIFYGYADNVTEAVIAIETYLLFSYGQCTDNILQHELSHLYDAEDHWSPSLQCVVNRYPVNAGLDGTCPKGFTTDKWCRDCISKINENRERWGREEIIIDAPYPRLPYTKEEVEVEP